MRTFTQKRVGVLKRLGLGLGLGLLGLCLLLSGPVANYLFAREYHVQPGKLPGRVYLVCGAREQADRIRILTHWLALYPSWQPDIVVGNDTQNSLWSTTHQRNLTRAEWSAWHLQAWAQAHGRTLDIAILPTPHAFVNTDGEMKVLREALAMLPPGSNPPQVALVTSPYHARRSLQRFRAQTPPSGTNGLLQTRWEPLILPAPPPVWRYRKPWIVGWECMKILRDRFGLSQVPGFTRRRG